MKFLNIVFLIAISSILFAEKVEITSDSMKAEHDKKEVHFIGNVKIKQLENKLFSGKVIVYFDDKNETKKYEALDHVTFEFKKEKIFYKGSADKVIYFPLKSKYILTGKAVIDDLVNDRHIKGEEITLDMISGNASVKGADKKPVKFIFDMEKSK